MDKQQAFTGIRWKVKRVEAYLRYIRNELFCESDHFNGEVPSDVGFLLQDIARADACLVEISGSLQTLGKSKLGKYDLLTIAEHAAKLAELKSEIQDAILPDLDSAWIDALECNYAVLDELEQVADGLTGTANKLGKVIESIHQIKARKARTTRRASMKGSAR